MSGVIYVIPLLICLSSTVSALKCYECDSSKNVACDMGLLAFTQNVKDCSSDSSFIGGLMPSECTKIVARGKNGEEYIKRGCGISTGFLNNCQAVAKTLQFAIASENIASIDCYPCNTDKCNSSTSLRAFSLLGIFVACLLYLL